MKLVIGFGEDFPSWRFDKDLTSSNAKYHPDSVYNDRIIEVTEVEYAQLLEWEKAASQLQNWLREAFEAAGGETP